MKLSAFPRLMNFAAKVRGQATKQRSRNRSRRLLLEALENRRVFAAFSPGNLLVLQATGDTASANASAVSLVEYTTSGVLVQTIPVSSAGGDSLTLRGTSGTEGALSISSDGQWVTFGGYRADAGSANPSSAGVPRVIGRVDVNGTVNTSQSFSDGYTGDSFRSVATDDGSRFWLSGAGSGTTGSVRFMANTTDTTTSLLTANGGNSRQIQVINGQLYVSSGSNIPGRSVFQVGTGLPTSGTQTFVNAIPIVTTPQYQSFFFADLNASLGWNGSTLDTLYTTDTNTAGGPVTKWTFDGTNWANSGSVGIAGMTNITGFVVGSTVTLYGTTSTTGTGGIKTLSDASGYNGAFAGSWSDLSNAVVAGGTTAFRGITRVPQVAATQLVLAATDATKLEGDAGATAFTFTVTRTGPVGGTSSANWAVTGSGGSPANATDFFGGVLPSGTVNFLANETSKTITVNVNGDLTSESDEGFTVTLTSPVGAILGQSTAAGSILNDDAATDIAISATDANKAEGNSGTTNFTFTVTRTGIVAGVTSTATYTVSGSGASQATAADFVGGVFPTGTVTFAPGQTSQLVTIPVAGDITIEGDEGFIVTLSNPSLGTAIVGLSANGVIVNDDSSFALSPGTLSAAEGNAGSTPMVFTVTRSGDLSIPSNVAWSVAGSGASPAVADDFAGGILPSGVLNFLATEVSKTISINVQGDTVFEGFDGFTVTLDSASVGVIATGTANGIIAADDFQSLSAGDLVITGIGSDNPDTFSFVPLVNLQPNAPIVFTDNAWNGSALLTNEGAMVYQAPAGGLTAGTKVIIEFDSTTPAINILAGSGTAQVVGSFGLSTDGDSLLAYVGLSTSPNFLYAVTTSPAYLTSGVPTTNQTYLPSTLTVGSTAVDALGVQTPTPNEVDNAQYDHALGTSGTAAQIRALVSDKANWLTDDLPITLDPANFTVVPSAAAPKVQSTQFGSGQIIPGATLPQRSMITSITVSFDAEVIVDPNAFLLEVSPITGGGSFAAVTFTVNQATNLVAGKTVATLTFSGTGIIGGSLPDGNYRVTALSSKIRSTSGGIALDGDNNGSAGGDFLEGESATDNFFRLFGDSDGNGSNTPIETNRFRSTVGRSTGDPAFNPLFDFDSNGSITPADTNQFRSRVGRTRLF